jgi:hypothetical protein
VQEDVHGVVPRRRELEESDVERVRQPRQRVPVARLRRPERLDDVRGREAPADERGLLEVLVVVVDERPGEGRDVREGGGGEDRGEREPRAGAGLRRIRSCRGEIGRTRKIPATATRANGESPAGGPSG